MLSTDMFAIVLVFVVFQSGLYLLMRAACTDASSKTVRKTRAWLLSLHISFLFGCLLAPLYLFWTVRAVQQGTGAFDTFWRAETYVERGLCLYFVAFCLVDLLIGMLEYREYIAWDTGILNTSVFIFIVLYVFLKHNLGVFFLIYSPFEVPTFILALGTVFPSWRSDLWFGVTFFAFRIVYHIFMFAYCLVVATSVPAWAVWASGTLPLLFHFVWFFKWGVGQLKRARKEA